MKLFSRKISEKVSWPGKNGTLEFVLINVIVTETYNHWCKNSEQISVEKPPPTSEIKINDKHKEGTRETDKSKQL